jgi:subtilisin family serine protease
MDVRKRFSLVWILMIQILFMVSCAQEKTESVPFNDNSKSLSGKLGDCDSLTLKNKFIVEWKDGRFSVHTANSKDEFLTGFVKDNLHLIKQVEYDEIQKFRSEEFQTSNVVGSSKLQTWGQDAIRATDVWNQGYFGQGVSIGVVDTQIDIGHGLIRDQIAVNTGEIPGNNIDDDRNGFIDDYKGVLFVEACTSTGSHDDCQKHATHISGIIAGTHDVSVNGPMKGLAPRSKIIQAAFLGRDGSGDLSNAVLALQYVADRGAKIINASWGSGQCGMSLKNKIAALSSQNILVVAAAGNSGSDISAEYNRVYPAAFQFPNLLVVAAGTIDHFMAGFSNSSYSLVHVAAPGADIYSSVPRRNGYDQYELMDGTSMATPFVVGSAALLMSAKPNASTAQIVQALKETVDTDDLHSYKVSTKGRINLAKAMVRLKELVP